MSQFVRAVILPVALIAASLTGMCTANADVCAGKLHLRIAAGLAPLLQIAVPGARENGVREAPRKTRTADERGSHGEPKGKYCGRSAKKGLNPGQTETTKTYSPIDSLIST
jgi:hypothetical protein